MIRINLLPHRELKKAAHRKRFQNMLAAALLAGLGLSYAGYSWLDSTLSEQQRRNQQLQTAIAKLDKELSNIETLRRQRLDMLTRKELVERLQHSRTEATSAPVFFAIATCARMSGLRPLCEIQITSASVNCSCLL